jgi:flagellar protein FlaJ
MTDTPPTTDSESTHSDSSALVPGDLLTDGGDEQSHGKSVEHALPDDVNPEAATSATAEAADEAVSPTAAPAVRGPPTSLSQPVKSLSIWLATFFHTQTNILNGIEETVSSADIPPPTDLFFGRVVGKGLAYGGAAGFIMGACVIVLAAVFKNPSTLINSPRLLGGGAITIVAITGFIVSVYISGRIGFIYLKVSSRQREIEALLPDAISYMYTLSAGNMNHLDVIRSLAKADNTYGEVSREFHAIVREAEYFGADYQDAILKQSQLTPSDELSRFLTDLLTVIRSGGNLAVFLETEADLARRHAHEAKEQELDFRKLIAKLYLAISLFLLIAIIIVISISTFQPISILPIALIVYVLIPIVLMGFFMAISGILSDMMGSGELADSSPAQGSIFQDETEATDTIGDGETALNSTGNQRTLSSSFGTDLSSSNFQSGERRAPKTAAHPAGDGILSTPAVDDIDTDHSVFDQISSRIRSYRINKIISEPHIYFQGNPLHTIPVTALFAIAVLLGGVLTGLIPVPTRSRLVTQPVSTTLWWLYFPIMTVITPIAIFDYYHRRVTGSVFKQLPETLRSISSANETGMTLLESIKSSISEDETRMDEELSLIYEKAKLGIPLEQALIEFNNTYNHPKVARIVRLIVEAQRSSDRIADILKKTVESAENQLRIQQNQIIRTRAQAAIVAISTLILLAAMLAIHRGVLPVLTSSSLSSITQSATAAGQEGGNTNLQSSLTPEATEVLFLHGVTIHAIFSGIIAGYLEQKEIISGAKYILILMTTVAVAWILTSSPF